MMSQHSNNFATATAILVHNENLVRLCTKMAAVSMANGCMQALYCCLTSTKPLPMPDQEQLSSNSASKGTSSVLRY